MSIVFFDSNCFEGQFYKQTDGVTRGFGVFNPACARTACIMGNLLSHPTAALQLKFFTCFKKMLERILAYKVTRCTRANEVPCAHAA